MKSRKLTQLIHNGILVPDPYSTQRFTLTINGTSISLTAHQEEMAIAWVKKLGTEYVQDPVFKKNFSKDFKVALSVKGSFTVDNCDFSELLTFVEKEKQVKESLSKEEVKILREKRKVVREDNKTKYGYAFVNGERIEIGNYVAEPSSIFMGRGKHPLRGRWKPGPKQSDIILNLSPDAPKPPGNWKAIVWDSNVMWIAKWHDKLSDKMKYVWLSDTSPQKQLSDIEKFDRAKQLKGKIRKVRIHIKKNLISANNQRRKVATVCYLIDTLKLRVGDEKDTDEADTVGATTLRPLHIQIKNDNRVSFNFLGKDSIPWRKEVKLPETIITNIKEFMGEAQSPIFKGVHSDTVSDFLSEAVKGLTAKVFRTYYSTYVVDDYLSESTIEIDSPDYLKKQTATIANLQAAVMCNHKRKLPKNWQRTLYKRVERLKTLKQQLHKKRTKELNRLNSNISDLQSRKQTTKRKETIKKYKAKYKQLKKNKYTPAQKERLSKMESRIKVMNETRDYNLNTSLKSYIDPRIFFQWTQKVDYDWRNIYPKTLQKKFSWIEQSNP